MRKMSKFLMIMSLLLVGCNNKIETSSSISSSSLIVTYDDLQPFAYCSFDKKDENSNYYDEISGEPFYIHGSIESAEGKFGDAAVFDGRSSMELGAFKNRKFKGNKSHTIMAYVKVDVDNINGVPGYVIGGIGEYSHLADSRLMVYNKNLCVTSYDLFALSELPNDINEKWYHLAMTYDGSTYKLFVNKKQMVVIQANEGINIKNNSLFIGGFNNNTMSFLGEIDEFYMFDKALTIKEIGKYYDNKAVVKMNNPTNNTPITNGIKEFKKDNFEFENGQWNDFYYLDENGAYMPLRLYVPLNYSFKKDYPVILFLHGDGGNGAPLDNIVYGEGITTVLAATQYEECFCIVPMASASWLNVPNDYGGSYPYRSYSMSSATPSIYLHAADNLLKYAEENLNIDKTKVFLNGYSRGTMGSWYLLDKYPNRFAASILCCGAGDPTLANTLKETPIWYFHGDKDPLVDINDCLGIIDAINKAGGNAKYTICEGYQHDLISVLKTEPGLIDWLFSHSKIK